MCFINPFKSQKTLIQTIEKFEISVRANDRVQTKIQLKYRAHETAWIRHLWIVVASCGVR